MNPKTSRDSGGRIRLGVLLAVLVAAMALGVVALASALEDKMALAQGAGYLSDGTVTQTIALSNVSAQYTLPRAGDPYVVCARGNAAYLRCGAIGVAATTAAGGYSFSVPAGACLGPVRLIGPVCAHIAGTAVGTIEFLRLVASQN